MGETLKLVSAIQPIAIKQSVINTQMDLHSGISTILNLFSKIKMTLKLVSEFELEEL